jgi:hypothetical protein
MKDKTLNELLEIFNEVSKELTSRRYFEYILNIGKWFRNVPDPSDPDAFPGKGMTVPIKEMDEILNAIDAQNERFLKHPQLEVYRNIVIDREELGIYEPLVEKLWNETIKSKQFTA